MSARAAKPIPGLTLGAEPRANLLPPEVLEHAKARRVRGFLVLIVVIAVVATAGGYAYASIQALSAQAGLSAAQTRTTELLQEKSSYAEVIAAADTLSLITSTQQQATSTEVIWGEFIFDELVAAVPGQVLFVNRISATAPMPWEAPLQPAGALRLPRVTSFELRYTSPSPPDAAALYRVFSSIDWVADISVDLVEWSEETQNYATTITINLNADALSARWAEEEAADDAVGETAEGQTAEEEVTGEGQ